MSRASIVLCCWQVSHLTVTIDKSAREFALLCSGMPAPLPALLVHSLAQGANTAVASEDTDPGQVVPCAQLYSVYFVAERPLLGTNTWYAELCPSGPLLYTHPPVSSHTSYPQSSHLPRLLISQPTHESIDILTLGHLFLHIKQMTTRISSVLPPQSFSLITVFQTHP